MELDLTQVRAFVVTAEQLHFGRAAARLFLTQQALSKRIQRLEHRLGEPLFVRGARGVELTEAGHRFLPHAKALLAAAGAAAEAARPESWPLRLDVWGQVQAPLRIVRRLLGEDPELTIELSMRRSLGAALEALERGELDACFGRVHHLGHPWPSGLAHRPVVLERLAVAVNADHPLAGAPQLRPADLREPGLWLPTSGSPAELVGAYRQIAGHFGIPLHASGHNLGLEHVIDQLRRHPRRLILFGADWPLPPDAGIRRLPLHPKPCFLWSLVWPERHQHPQLELLLERAAQAGRAEGWLAYDPRDDWLPDTDLAELHDQPADEPKPRGFAHGTRPDLPKADRKPSS
jgi:DNA-binding transcriptional LysR family regulator